MIEPDAKERVTQFTNLIENCRLRQGALYRLTHVFKIQLTL